LQRELLIIDNLDINIGIIAKDSYKKLKIKSGEHF